MNLFKGKIYCLRCGKRYNFKNDNGSYIYICSGYKNYGSSFCPRNMIQEQDIINIILKHLKLQEMTNISMEKLRDEVERIDVRDNALFIQYIDGSISEWNDEKIKF